MVNPDADTALILLAAGRSRRFGSDKLVAAFRGAPLWSWAARAAEQAGFAHRYLVVGPHSAISPRPGWQVVLNSRADEGMGASIAAGVAQARRHSRL
ncbi:MAG: NTP transferase domain-containing protein, partial [Pseudomonadota bacterium]|nr:NTP transferase domain-containing protein [Pseudomonadota bacterium]